MRNINKAVTGSHSQPSQVSMKNKARLSEVTAFSFGIHQEPSIIHQISLINSFMIIDSMLRITNQNEISKNSLILPLMPPVITKH
jgi:hypothetical protein